MKIIVNLWLALALVPMISQASTIVFRDGGTVSGGSGGPGPHSCADFPTNGIEANAIANMEANVPSSCSVSDIQTSVAQYSFCQMDYWHWTAVGKLTCFETFDQDFDPIFYENITSGYGKGGQDAKEQALKVSVMAKQHELDPTIYLQVRSGPNRGQDTYIQAGQAATAVSAGSIDGDFYLSIRKGPRNGIDLFEDAIAAATAVKTGKLDAKCYLSNRAGPEFGDKSFADAMSLCSKSGVEPPPQSFAVNPQVNSGSQKKVTSLSGTIDQSGQALANSVSQAK